MLTKKWNAPGVCADDPNCYSIYYKSAYAFHAESGGSAKGVLYSCGDIAHIVNKDACPATDPGSSVALKAAAGEQTGAAPATSVLGTRLLPATGASSLLPWAALLGAAALLMRSLKDRSSSEA